MEPRFDTTAPGSGAPKFSWMQFCVAFVCMLVIGLGFGLIGAGLAAAVVWAVG